MFWKSRVCVLLIYFLLKMLPSFQIIFLTDGEARIARGDIEDLKNLNVDQYDALFFPGGCVLFFWLKIHSFLLRKSVFFLLLF